MKGHYYFKILFTLLFLFFCTNVGWSNQLSPDQALRRASGKVAATRSSSGGSYNLSFTGNKDGKNILYVFNNSRGGFIVVSADDSMPALLGYSNSGSFSETTASPTLKWWLGQYTSEGSYYLHNEDKYKKETRSTRASKTNIPAMVTTNWNQSKPYNNDCPEVGGKKTVTGCVATALAQVIRYHAYPTTGTGSHSYSWNGETLSFDYGSTTFDYANMLNDYDSNSTEAQDAAVANLMYACGVGVNMDYGINESGAADMYIPYALKNFFGYTGDVKYLPRNYFTNSDWEDMVYAELAAKRPVIYGGQSNSGGGHEFVCDGYEDGYFHINWGWGGMGNGYFLLSALDPGLQGTGGYEGGYNTDQTMICGIEPTGSGNNWYPIYSTAGLQISSVQANKFLSISLPNGGIYNYSPETVSVEFYLKVVSKNGETHYSEQGYEMSFSTLAGYTGLAVYIPQGLPEGDYTASVVMKTPEGNWQEVLVPVTDVSGFDMNVDSSGNITFKEAEPLAKAIIEVTNFNAQGKVESGSEATFDITVKNTGEYEYSGVFYVRVYKEGTEKELTQNGINTSIAVGGELSGTVPFTFELEDGKYDAVFYDKYGDKISKVFPLYIGQEPTVAEGISLDNTEASITEGETLTLTATVSPEDASDKTVTWSSSDTEVATVENGVVTAVKVGTATITAETVNGHKATCEITVKAKEVAAEGITLDQTEATLTVEGTLTLTATVSPETTTDKTVTWSSSDTEVATVENGVVTAVKVGTATITAETVNGHKATCEITVKAKEVAAEGISLDKTEATLTVEETLTLTATVSPETTTDKTVTWSSSDTEVATVENGVVTAVKVGTATITAETVNGHKATCEVTVKAKEVAAEGITLDQTEATLTVEGTLTLTATVSPETTTDKTVTWSSSDTEVATVENGVVTAVKVGTATITAETVNGHKATCEITVKAKEVAAEGISLDKTEATLTVEGTLTLTATVSPETTTDKTVTWSSSDTEVATVENGKITAVKVGTATITAETVNGHKATCEITVKAKEVAAEGITLDQTEVIMAVEETLTLTATVSPETTTDKTVTWSSSDTEVATVENGVVTAVKVGTATITAETVNGHKATCEITVKAKEVAAEGISLDKTEATLTVEETLTLVATISPEATTDKTVTWSSSDTEVATVENGKVTAVKAGTATITAETVNGHKATCEITVKAKEVAAEGITLDKTEAIMAVEETLTLTATVSPETTTDKTVTWSSSDTEVATVENGKVTAVKVGTATITAETVNGHKATCEITVKAKEVAAEGITLDQTEATLTVEGTLTLTATVSPETTTDKTVTWSSSDTEVATVENGVVTAVKVGTATITAETVNGLKATCEITVKANVVAAEGITLDTTEATLTEGETLTLTATVSPEATTDKTVTWSSSDTEVATVENGKVTAVKAGTATITAETINGLKATCEVTVNAKEVAAEGITLDRTEATIEIGEKLTLTATVSPEATTDKTVTWSSSDTEVVTVENGVVTAVKVGTSTITAETVNGLKATCTVTVKDKVILAEGISLDKTEVTLTEEETLTLTATVTPDNTTDKTVTWSSSDTEVVTVENGKVTAVKAGTATITAETINGLKATCEVTVKEKEPEFIPATSITLDKTSIEAIVGTTVTLTATVLPENATDKTVTWSSSNETVATVDNNGKVSILSVGNAVITATTNDGTQLKAECTVSGVSGIEALVLEAGSADVYSVNGFLVKKNADSEYISNLPNGTYIIRIGNNTYKVIK